MFMKSFKKICQFKRRNELFWLMVQKFLQQERGHNA
jgi:hypothetical protein